MPDNKDKKKENEEFMTQVVRKIIKVGDSAAITLPKDYLEAHNLEVGDKVRIIFNRIFLGKPIKIEELKEELSEEIVKDKEGDKK